MKTPIIDFVRRYADSGALRLHMPGHKGQGEIERNDITEIGGADSLYEAEGIIRESEANASELFGCNTFYSTEGSSQCIRAMLYLVCRGVEKPRVLAGRNVHKTFLSAAALIGFDVDWLYGEGESYLCCSISPESVEAAIAQNKPACVYITSPDYLGNTADVAGISAVCRAHNVSLLVDAAHGAYLRFLESSKHPIDLGADMCCTSAHKTLPTLTGGAYLHIADDETAKNVKSALALFGSTSPSYLIMQSLDKTNRYLAEGYREKLAECCRKVAGLRARLAQAGYEFIGDEPLKLTVDAKKYGYLGHELATELEARGIVHEFADPDYLVLMLTPETPTEPVMNALLAIEEKPAINESAPRCTVAEQVMSPREAMLLHEAETVSVDESIGRVLVSAAVGCPPAVPIVCAGERIDHASVECFKYYGIKEITVIKNYVK